MALERIIVQFFPDGVWVTAVKLPAKEILTVFSSFAAVSEGRIAADVLGRLRAVINVQRAEVVIILPPRQVIYKYFLLPSKDKKELRRMIGLQVGHGLAFSPQEIIYDLAVAGQNPEGSSHVMVGITRQTTVEQCLNILSSSGLQASRCVVSSFGVSAWLSNRYDPPASECVVVVDLQSESLEFSVCQNKQLWFARAFSLPEGSVTQALAQQIDATIEAFQRACPHMNPAKIILTGVRAHRQDIKDQLTKKWQIPCQDALEDEHKQETEPSISLCATKGVAGVKEWKLDLMPSSAQHVSFLHRERMALFRVSLGMLLFGLVLFFLTRSQLNMMEKQLQTVRQQMQISNGAYQMAKRNLALYETIRSQQKRRVIMAEVFKELYAALPPSVVLTNFQYADGNVTILGQSKESADVGTVQKALMASPIFTDVTLQYANRPQRLGMELTEFKMVCRLKTIVSEAP